MSTHAKDSSSAKKRDVAEPVRFIPDYILSGPMVRHLMRKHGVTIRGLAQKFNITMTRVREVRANGVRGFAASEWHFLIAGCWLDNIVGEISR